ncbi:MAG: CusA/CzcA family heavy metal efflux RND transporter [Acidobacteriota bacterium]|nr:CusA/CzcA family heavy metal efflux RND transporter [Acidobacteriota bacterium]
MIARIIRFSLEHRLFVVPAALAVLALGYASYRRLSIDVFPDASPTLVQVFTEAEGMAPEEVERFISYPMESVMSGLPRVQTIRSVSTFALSIVSVYFEDGADIYWARQLVSQRLLEAVEDLPDQAGRPVLGPIATGLGLVYLYYLEGGDAPLIDVRTSQDWIVRFELKAVPEVTEVLSFGGDVKQFHILVDPDALLKYGLQLSEVADAVRSNNRNVGASFITRGPEEYVVRSLGLVGGLDDLGRIVVSAEGGTPVYLRDVAEVRILPAIKRGEALVDGKGPRVTGMVLKLFGANTARLIESIENRVAEINRILPPGMEIVPFYNQAGLVRKCFETVSNNLILGMLLVVVVLFVFMGELRTAVTAVLALPFSILFAFIGMHLLRLPADLMSFGGLAVAIGLLVDAAIIFVENAHSRLQSETGDRAAVILDAGREVARPLFFAVAIIILVFLPIFTLTGVEGVMFRPMGVTVSTAMAGSLLFTLAVAPALAFIILKRKRGEVREPAVLRAVKKAYMPFFESCRRRKRMVFVVTAAVFAAGAVLFPFLGREYIPTLEEGTLLLMATLDPNISLEQSVELATAMEKEILTVPGVGGVLTQIGRGDVGSHAHFVNDVKMYIAAERGKARSREELSEEIGWRLERFPGVAVNLTQPIAHNLDELVTGVKAQVAVKIYGEDFDVLRQAAAQIQEILEHVPGGRDVQVEQFTGQNHISVVLDREAVARYGLNIREIQETVEAAVGGVVLGHVYEEQRKFDIFLRYADRYRSDVESIGGLLIGLPGEGGGRIPLRALAEIREGVGPRQIQRENNRRFITVQANVRGRDIGRFVAEAQRLVEDRVKTPPGYAVAWGGQFELQQKANRRLMVVMPITLALVALLLFAAFSSFREVLVIMINIPLALTGGVLALKIAGAYLSVPASIGFIAVFGIALQDGLVLMSHFKHLEGRMRRSEAVLRGVEARIRPVLMTTLTTIFGLLPLLVATGVGAEIQRPLATVVVGGLATSTLVTLLVLPLVYEAAWLWKTKDNK